MNDPSTLSLALTYAATLGVAVLMFRGQFIALTALLVLAGTMSFLAQAARLIMRRRGQ